MASVIVALVLLSAAYRAAFALAALLARPARPAPKEAPSIQILVAAGNEQGRFPAFLEALEALAYERGKLAFVFADDGSADATPRLLEGWSAGVRAPEWSGWSRAGARAPLCAAPGRTHPARS